MAGPFTKQLPRLVQAEAAGLYKAANRIINRSQELVPVETGTLKGSARVLLPVVTPDGVEVRCGYGYGETVNPLTDESAAGYAVFVHEDLTARHDPPTSAKFLEIAASEERRAVVEEVAMQIEVGGTGRAL